MSTTVIEDNSEAFLESLPELGTGETFVFACNERVPCFNRCCAELTLPLTPYDVLRLRTHLGVDSETFLRSHTQMRSFPDTGFPLPLLRMLDGPGEPCPFVTPGGCVVYEDRPGACRAYPLGRATKMGRDGVVERFFVVREDHCCGFDTGQHWTAPSWLGNQELEPYNAANDRYMRLMAMVKATNEPISAKLASMCVMAFYHVEKFREFLIRMGVLDKLDLSDERRAALMEHDDACLDFAFDWIELVVFDVCPHLARH